MSRTVPALTFVAVTLISSVALAETNTTSGPVDDESAGAELFAGPRFPSVPTPPEALQIVKPHAAVSPIIYLNRCRPNYKGASASPCDVTAASINDASSLRSSIPISQGASPGAIYTISEFENDAGQTGAMADAEWDAIVECVKEVYSPFNTMVTDVKPTSPTFHHSVVGGTPTQLAGLDTNIGGISPGVGCNAVDNLVTFTFANTQFGGSGQNRIWYVCAVIAQESAHSYSLDHSYSFPGARSACNDPMTYREDCGGQKFFRNDQATCGEYDARPCSCGATQNSHLKLLSVFGAGTPTTPKPTVTVNPPAGGSIGVSVTATAFSKRGIAKLELFLNDYKWAETKGNAFGSTGQPEASYALLVPAGVPNSTYDIKVRALDDLGNYTDSATVTANKGAPCTSADTCLKGQLCEAGKCFWEAPTGAIGDACTYPQFCESGICQGTAEQTICTQVCIPGVIDSCPEGGEFTCIETNPGTGICFFADTDTGCCSTGTGETPWAPGALGLGILGFLVIRRRRA